MARWSYFHRDAQNHRLLTDGAVGVSKRWEYDPFGTLRAETGAGDSDFDYAGEQRDGETGLLNLRARLYDPVLGRFITRDSFDGMVGVPQSWNRYSYAENDPVNSTDPDGHKKKKKGKSYDKDDYKKAKKKAKACRNPGQYTGSCPHGPPNKEYAWEGERDALLKEFGKRLAEEARARSQPE